MNKPIKDLFRVLSEEDLAKEPRLSPEEMIEALNRGREFSELADRASSPRPLPAIYFK